VPADASAATAVSASHQVSDLAFDFRAGGCVVGLPRRVGLPRARWFASESMTQIRVLISPQSARVAAPSGRGLL
jgi:hypothetical protein